MNEPTLHPKAEPVSQDQIIRLERRYYHFPRSAEVLTTHNAATKSHETRISTEGLGLRFISANPPFTPHHESSVWPGRQRFWELESFGTSLEKLVLMLIFCKISSGT